MALITITMALALSDFLSTAVPDPGPGGSWEVGAGLEDGNRRWGDGDEEIHLVHRGGPDLDRDTTKIVVDVAGDLTTYEGASLGSAFTDGAFTIGERWVQTTDVPPNASVSVTVAVTSPRPRVVASAQLHAGRQDCSDDQLAPYVVSWSQSPFDVDSGTVGDVSIVATVADACAGVDTNVTPHLEYRIGTGTFTDTGEMSWISGTSWRGDVPEPTDGWDAHENETLTYRIDPMADHAGNNGTSEEQTDEIQAGTSSSSTLTYATDHVVFSGVVENGTNLRNGTDDGHAANLTENATGAGLVTSEIYGTAHSSDGALQPGGATGSPDGSHAVLPSDNDWVSVTGYNTFEGVIESVEIAFEGHYNGTANGAEDELRLAYTVSGTEGATDASFALSELSEGADGPAEYVNVTADRAWTWTDIANLAVEATYEKRQSEDAVDFDVDALWTRVVYEDPAYNLSIQVNVTGIPSGTGHDLEIRYNTSGEPFHVEVYNNTSASWETRGSALGSTSTTTWALALEDAEVDNGTVLMRFVDDGPDATERDTIAVDFVRVRTG